MAKLRTPRCPACGDETWARLCACTKPPTEVPRPEYEEFRFPRAWWLSLPEAERQQVEEVALDLDGVKVLRVWPPDSDDLVVRTNAGEAPTLLAPYRLP